MKAFIFVISIFLLISACGERYPEEGRALSAKLVTLLRDRGYCKPTNGCDKTFVIYGGHDFSISYDIFGVTDKNDVDALIEELKAQRINVDKKIKIKTKLHQNIEDSKKPSSQRRPFLELSF